MLTLLQLLVASTMAAPTLAQSAPTIPPPGQPLHTGAVGQFEIIGNTLVSSQQVSIAFVCNIAFS